MCAPMRLSRIGANPLIKKKLKKFLIKVLTNAKNYYIICTTNKRGGFKDVTKTIQNFYQRPQAELIKFLISLTETGPM